ncbi:MAG: hypothetical protein EPO21_16335 [Chloroflexota bacterium]|nr:MAG: hypothetical protein EPO21_16335 [Chloroflexota bacterium]
MDTYPSYLNAIIRRAGCFGRSADDPLVPEKNFPHLHHAARSTITDGYSHQSTVGGEGKNVPFVSVEEIFRLALPAGTVVLAGRDGLDRDVSWAATLRVRPPVLPSLRGGELVLLSAQSLQQLDPPVPFEALVQRLSERGVSGLLVLGDVTPEALRTADARNIPILALPSGVNLNELESFVTRTITERRAELYRQGMRIQRTLATLAIEGQGLAGIVRGLSDLLGKAVVLESEIFEPRALSGQGALEKEALLQLLADTAGGRSYDFSPTQLASSDPPTVHWSLGRRGLGLLVSPVLVRGQVVGYLSAIGAEGEWSSLDRLGVAHGASACALELAKERAVLEAENRLRGSFLDQLLSGSVIEPEEVAARARYLGWNLGSAYIVAIFRLDEAVDVAVRPDDDMDKMLRIVRGEILRWSPGALLQDKSDSITALYSLTENQTAAQVRTAIEQCRRGASARLNGARVSAGVGRLSGTLVDIPSSRGEALQALAIAQGLFGGDCSADFSELGVYRLLFPLKGRKELSEFYTEVLGPLLDYDQKHDSELLKTLESFFTCQGSLQKTAEELFLHRNTLAYRLRRIEELTGLDLSDLENRFQFQLALKIRRVLV